MSFESIFVNYWDMAITGFIGGLVFYLCTQNDFNLFGTKFTLKNRIVKAIFIFAVALLLVFVYSLLVYFLK